MPPPPAAILLICLHASCKVIGPLLHIFLCIKCNKAFKLKGHLKKHEKICKGFLDYIKCSNCENVFKSGKTLRQHKVKCKAEQNYECKECESYFKSYSKFSEHREKNHKKVVCDLCGKDIHFKNITMLGETNNAILVSMHYSNHIGPV